MKKNSTIIILLFIITVTFALGCKKKVLKNDRKIFIGVWNWQYTLIKHSCDGVAEFDLHDPLLDSTTYQIEFFEEGIIHFKKDNIVVREHKFAFFYSEIPEGIVESHKEFNFKIYFDEDKSKTLFGTGSPKEIQMNYYPFETHDADCIIWMKNIFSKQY